MSNEELKSLLLRLQEALKNTSLDEEARVMLANLDGDIDRLLSGQDDADSSPIIEGAKRLETLFAVEHPVAERTLREMADLLGKLGI